jgi:hypothetical protein
MHPIKPPPSPPPPPMHAAPPRHVDSPPPPCTACVAACGRGPRQATLLDRRRPLPRRPSSLNSLPSSMPRDRREQRTTHQSGIYIYMVGANGCIGGRSEEGGGKEKRPRNGNSCMCVYLRLDRMKTIFVGSEGITGNMTGRSITASICMCTYTCKFCATLSLSISLSLSFSGCARFGVPCMRWVRCSYVHAWRTQRPFAEDVLDGRQRQQSSEA